jgi:arylsulfatase A-like enzyme
MTCRSTRLRAVCSVVALTAWLTGVATAAPAPTPARRPNIVVILLDDLGYSDLGCYGGEIHTPNIDRLAASGVRFTRFYNAARCCPTRAALLTGLYPHQVGLARNGRNLTRDGATIAELLRTAGYQTAMAGKWHLSETVPLNGKAASREHFSWLEHQTNRDRPFADPNTYPVNRGFERHYGTIWGVVNYFDPFSLVEGTRPVEDVPDDYYLTDAITAKSVEFIHTMSRKEMPFFLYVAHCAPHWPLHARPEDIDRYRNTYRSGWHALRDQRYRKQVERKLIDPATHPLPKLMGTGPDWDALGAEELDHESNLMAVHAAMVDRVDQGIGTILRTLQEARCSENTIIFLLSDNGASPERYLDPGFDRPSATRDGRPIRYTGRFTPGPETTWGYIGSYWASAVNTPFRYWKAESFEGGCHTPMIVHWPAGLALSAGSTVDQLGHVIDLMPTCLELAGVSYPARHAGHQLAPLEGKSLAAILQGGHHEDRHDALFFEHEGGRAVIADGWKLVARRKAGWELYHIANDATETHDLTKSQPRRVAELEEKWRTWATRVGARIPPGARAP